MELRINRVRINRSRPVPEKLCEAEAQKSDAVEPKQTESVTEAQKSDVCNEINKSDAVEQPEEPEKLCANEAQKSDAIEPEAQKTDICNKINKSDAVEQPEQPEKLCENEAQKSDTMEPKGTESEPEAQKSDVRGEVRGHLTEPKQIETETGPNESDNKSIGSQKNVVWKGDGVYTTDESEYEDNDTNQAEESCVWTEDSEGDSNSSYESYKLVIENCETKTETGKDCEVSLSPQCSNSKEERSSSDGSFEGFDASEIIPKLCSEDEYNKSDGLDGKFDTALALHIQVNVRKPVHDTINENEMDNGETRKKSTCC